MRAHACECTRPMHCSTRARARSHAWVRECVRCCFHNYTDAILRPGVVASMYELDRMSCTKPTATPTRGHGANAEQEQAVHKKIRVSHKMRTGWLEETRYLFAARPWRKHRSGHQVEPRRSQLGIMLTFDHGSKQDRSGDTISTSTT